MKDGITEKYTICKHCGTKCNHDDDGFDTCRFCLADASKDKDSIYPESISVKSLNY